MICTNPHVFGISVTKGTFQECLYGHTTLCVCVMLKKPKMVLPPKSPLGTTNLKLGMYTQLDSGSNMGRIPPGHTSSFICVRLKTVCTYVCMYVRVYPLYLQNTKPLLFRIDTSHSKDGHCFLSKNKFSKIRIPGSKT